SGQWLSQCSYVDVYHLSPTAPPPPSIPPTLCTHTPHGFAFESVSVVLRPKYPLKPGTATHCPFPSTPHPSPLSVSLSSRSATTDGGWYVDKFASTALKVPFAQKDQKMLFASYRNRRVQGKQLYWQDAWGLRGATGNFLLCGTVVQILSLELPQRN
ncbi:hypothetical protein BaRGS_00017475, partial [Batillaria attramentaria]